MVRNQIKESVLYSLWSLELFARRYTTAMLGAQSALVADSHCRKIFTCAHNDTYDNFALELDD